jgi:uncharacterized protein (TIGR02757 family)
LVLVRACLPFFGYICLMMLRREEIRELLDEKADLYNCRDFIDSDPVSIPHRYSRREDIEIAAFLSATIAWGQRPVIVRNAGLLMDRMDNSPHAFIMQAASSDLAAFADFRHRTFGGHDCIYFLKALQGICRSGGLEKAFSGREAGNRWDAATAISDFRRRFLSFGPPPGTSRHVANPLAGSSAKRINMFLRWMVRKDRRGVDFGLWHSISPADLCCPLDVHTARVARALGILKRKQADWKAVAELTAYLKTLDPGDPVRYDYALFGLGVFEKF